MDRNHIFERDNIISFSSRKKLIQFVAEYLADHYKQNLEFWRATAMDDEQEMAWFNYRIKVEVPKLRKALKQLLRVKLNRKKRFKFTYKSSFLKEAFREAGIIESSPKNYYPINVEYKINITKLVFERDVKSNRC